MTTVTLSSHTLTKISEDYPIVLLDMDSSRGLYYSIHGVLHSGENGLDRWYKFDGKDIEWFSIYTDVYVYNSTSSSISFMYDEYPDTTEDCSNECNINSIIPIVEEYP